MVFSSAVFLVYFLPLFLLLYYAVETADRGTLLRNSVTLLFSVVFYAWGAPEFVFAVLGTCVIDFYVVKFMHESKDPTTRKILLAVAVMLNLGLLLYFKYANFFVENFNTLLEAMGWEVMEWTYVALPIGISFFTFQKLTYGVDVYRGVHAPLSNPNDYLLYILMFPQMIAGPIVRFHTIADQLTERRSTVDDRLIGFYRFCIGLGKKVLVANTLGAQADAVFGMPVAELDSSLAWIGILAYTFQIYFDFSGYSDMAIGIGRMIGFKFPEN
ncbi:MAG: MBOAT family O-acyltransferase, partial [Bacteroidota bacterium]